MKAQLADLLPGDLWEHLDVHARALAPEPKLRICIAIINDHVDSYVARVISLGGGEVLDYIYMKALPVAIL